MTKGTVKFPFKVKVGSVRYPAHTEVEVDDVDEALMLGAVIVGIQKEEKTAPAEDKPATAKKKGGRKPKTAAAEVPAEE